MTSFQSRHMGWWFFSPVVKRGRHYGMIQDFSHAFRRRMVAVEKREFVPGIHSNTRINWPHKREWARNRRRRSDSVLDR